MTRHDQCPTLSSGAAHEFTGVMSADLLIAPLDRLRQTGTGRWSACLDHGHKAPSRSVSQAHLGTWVARLLSRLELVRG